MRARFVLFVAILCIAVPGVAQIAEPRPPTYPGPTAVLTAGEVQDLFRVTLQQGTSDNALQIIYLAYESELLRQYAKFTFGSVVFIQSTTFRNDKGLSEIDHWIVTAGLDGHLVSATHDRIIEDNSTVISTTVLPNRDEDAIPVARAIMDRFLGNLLWARL